ncbi:VOC family protein [Ktedonosporobacter rubrisoli]|uniref:VOC family protein n=1 Tax=Ktedonosporobacter rubrisoli TaxID=2509675 RepID=A0A4V0YYK4_KTERU|nr:VOC family protein [Ktedonosporobacter rubrisoli]QBD76531.1 VOC family protein [Ktedonosporobacter rubrisoli]
MITGLGHVAFRITDLEKALDFYCNKLGFREAFRLEREGEPSPWIVYIQVAPNQFIELFPGAQGENPAGGDKVGYNHFCLVVDDLSATLEALEKRGLTISGGPQQGLDHNWQYWLNDPDGNAIELMQIVAESPHAAAEASWVSPAKQ